MSVPYTELIPADRKLRQREGRQTREILRIYPALGCRPSLIGWMGRHDSDTARNSDALVDARSVDEHMFGVSIIRSEKV